MIDIVPTNTKSVLKYSFHRTTVQDINQKKIFSRTAKEEIHLQQIAYEGYCKLINFTQKTYLEVDQQTH